MKKRVVYLFLSRECLDAVKTQEQTDEIHFGAFNLKDRFMLID